MKTLTKEDQEAITPLMALNLLEEGNKRFVNNLKINRNLLQQANETSDGQHPFAIISLMIAKITSKCSNGLSDTPLDGKSKEKSKGCSKKSSPFFFDIQ